MRIFQEENPGHVHIRSLRTRFMIPLLAISVAVTAIAVSATLSLVSAAERDAAASLHALARAAADSGTSALPEGAVSYRLDRRGAVLDGADVIDPRLVTEILSRKEGSLVFVDYDGTRRVYGFTHTDTAYVAVGLPTDMVFAALQSSLFSWAAIGSLLVLLALALSFALGDALLLRRARRMSAGFRKLASGDLDAKRELVFGMGELDEVTAVFDTVAEKLRQAYATTETSVKKRTVELEFNKGMAELEKARTEALLASIGDGVIATDSEAKITFVNQEGARMLGYDPMELAAASVHSLLRLEDEKGSLVPTENRPTAIAIASAKKAASPVYPKPYYYVRRDKTRFPAQITVTPIVAEGSVAGTIQVFRDITAEMEFDRHKSEFISIASHQLRSPLSAAKWLVDMLRKGDVGKLQEKQQALADKLFDANERMVVLVNELLNVSRLESGTVKLTPQPTDIPKLVDAVVTESTPLLAQKKQTFKTALETIAPFVVDPSLIREVTANLISNASKYSPEGSVVSVSVRVDGENAVVSVEDQGIGIPQSDQPQMFRKFFRAGNAAKSVVSGTGLGLYVAKSVIEMHGGKIWFESVPDKGTTFFFSLPLAGASLKEGEVHLT